MIDGSPQYVIDAFVALAKAVFGRHWEMMTVDVFGLRDDSVRHWVKGKSRIPPRIFIRLFLMAENMRHELGEAMTANRSAMVFMRSQYVEKPENEES